MAEGAKAEGVIVTKAQKQVFNLDALFSNLNSQNHKKMIQLIGWTILHSLWQITLIVALYWIAKASTQKQTANTQYLLAISTLLATFLAPIITFYYLWSSQLSPTYSSTLTPITKDTIYPTVPLNTEEVVSMTPTSFVDYLPIIFPYLVAFWGIGVLFFTFRFIKNLNGVTQLQHAEKEWISRDWQTKINTFKAQLGIHKQVQVYLSSSVKEPLTFGHFKPVILLPISLITGFDPKAIETIILHELAHIKRHDYLVNLGQSIIEIILFYHPLVWWLSKEIRAVREHCCDDLVLAIGNNRNAYVETLTALQWRKAGVTSNRLSMTGIGEDGDFSRRIKRMFGVEAERKFSPKKWAALFGLLLLLIGRGIWINNTISSKDKLTNKDDLTFIVDEKTTESDFKNWIKTAKERTINLDFSPSVFDETNQLKELRGSYHFEGSSGDFFATNLQCTNVQFVLSGNHLSQPTFLYPCREKAAQEMSNIFHVNGTTERNDLLIWATKLANNKIKFNFDKSVFDNNSKLIEFNANYNDEHSRRSFSASDMSCSKFYYELVGNTLIGPTFLKDGESPPSISKNAKPINLTHAPNTKKTSFTIYNGMSTEAFFKKVGDFQNITGSTITFEQLTIYADSVIMGNIIGNIRPNRDGQQIHYFDIHDLEKYSLQLTGTANQIFPPAYINSVTRQIIQAKKGANNEKSTFIANRKTTKSELAEWAKSIQKHGVLFNYEKSVFDKEDRLVGLNGKFMGKCCYDNEFYVNVENAQVQMDIEDDYIYQPTIVRREALSAVDSEEEEEKQFSAVLMSNKEIINEVREKFNTSKEEMDRPLDRKADNWIQWGDKKIPFKDDAEKPYVPKLEFTKKEWNYLRKQPLTFYIAKEWYKIKKINEIVLVPKEKDPIMVKLHKDYYEIIKDENEQLTRLMASTEIGDRLIKIMCLMNNAPDLEQI